MPKILQLDRHVADLIAAGEVVERPASAVKELVENAVDAGASQVTVEIQNGGMSYLRVTDDGCGIAPEDAETAFLRHATSKLRTKEDLAAIGTLGFRGEALAAIASVSRIDLLTKTHEGEGLSLTLEAGRVVDRAPAGCPDGTTIVVRDLFFNTPARLKFLKRDTVEGSQVAAAVQRQALAHPEVAFRLIKDGETVLRTSGNGDLYAAVYQVLGRQLACDMVAVKSQWENMRLAGFVTKPTATRGNRNAQQFFVNGRPVKSPLMTAALEEAYANQLMTGRFPACVLTLELPPQAVDVNVHPAKTEVKFASERAVFDTIRFGVLSALNKAPARPEMQLEKKPDAPRPVERPEPRPPQSVGRPDPRPPQDRTAPKASGAFRTMNTEQFKAFTEALSAPEKKPVAPAVEKALQTPVLRQSAACAPAQPAPERMVPAPPARSAAPAEPEQTALPIPEAPDYRIVGEVLDTYIIVEQGGAVLFLDKHAAHERILFEKLRAEPNEIMSQLLLEPVPAELTREEAGALLDNEALLAQYGYAVEDFGGGCVLVRQIPADLDQSQARDALQELADSLLRGAARDPEALRDTVLHTIACKAAIKAGWHTEPAEREALVRQVMAREDIKYCPHGRPVITTLTKQQLEKQFKRT